MYLLIEVQAIISGRQVKIKAILLDVLIIKNIWSSVQTHILLFSCCSRFITKVLWSLPLRSLSFPLQDGLCVLPIFLSITLGFISDNICKFWFSITYKIYEDEDLLSVSLHHCIFST